MNQTRSPDAGLLREIRENLQIQIAGQSEALELQRKNYELVKRQFERAERIQDRAERIQDSGARLVAVARKSVFIVIPILVVLIVYVSWLLFNVIFNVIL
ncbi:MAG: hypothetical protein PVF08_04310 [Gammaproteobacteria bacterium]